MTRTENALFTVRLTTRQIAAVRRAVVELIRDTEWAEVFGEGEEVATLREALRILNEEAVSILGESKSSD